jgi:uncharacterized protein YPO0396
VKATSDKIAKLRAQLTALETKQKDENRKLDTRQKVVIGAAMLAEAKRDPEFGRQLAEIIKRNVTRPIDLEAVAPWLSTT